MIRVIEPGPFGCTLDHGIIQCLDEIPEGYIVTGITPSLKLQVAIVEHAESPGATRTLYQRSY